MAKIPARLSEGYFRLFEPVIARALESHPTAITFSNVNEWSINTTIARLRDAVLSYKRYRWDSAMIDRDQFNKVWPDLQIRIDNNTQRIVVGPRLRNAGRPAVKHLPKPEQVSVVNLRDEDVLSLEEVQAFMLLLETRRIRGPIQILGHAVDELETLVGDQDLTVFTDNGRIYIL